MTMEPALPIPAENLLPHRPPMLLVDRLCSYADGCGVVEACPGSDSILVDERGALDEVALVELMAQGYAAVKGYDDLVKGRPVQEGFLVGIRKLQITGRAATGDLLRMPTRSLPAQLAFRRSS